jgi:hypothetical protein
MTSEANRFWNDIAPKYRALHGLCPMTPEEADVEYDNTPAIPLNESEIQAMIDAAISGQATSWEPKVKHWTPNTDLEAVEEEMLAMYREEGKPDAETDAIEEELRKRMLSDEPTEEQD